MKKTKFLTLAALFTILTAIFCINAYAQETEVTLYIDQNTTVEASSQNGTSEAPFSTTKAAQTYAKTLDAETVVLYFTGDFTQVHGGNGTIGIDGKTVKVTAESNAVKFTLPAGTLYPPAGRGNVEFSNITLVKGLKTTEYYDIDMRGYNLTFGKGLKTSGDLHVNQVWSTDTSLDNQTLTFDTEEWANFHVNVGNYAGGTVKGNVTVNINGLITAHTMGVSYRNAGSTFLGTQNYIVKGGSTVRELLLGKGTAQHGKRYVQINKGGVIDVYTTGDSASLTSESYSGVNIIEINGGIINSTGDGTVGGINKTEPANYKKINAYPGSEEAWKNVTRVVIFNNNASPEVTVGDTGAIAVRVAKGGYASAVTTEPTEANNWACELLGFEIDIPDGYSTVLIDGEIATANDGLYSITEAGAHTVTFEKDYEITVSADNAEAGTVTGAGTYAYGTKATLKAEANFGFAFDGWYLGEEKVSADAVYEAEVKANADYVAKFVKAKIEIGGNVILANENGTPYNETYDDGTTYNNAAVLNVYDGEELVFTATEDENGTLEFAFSEELGTYRVVIVKNGYLTFDEEIEIAKGDELSGIKLIPGDIKGSYEDACGDGKVDIDDFVRVLRGFNADSADKLRHAVDINEDREVNVTDLGFIKATLNK